MRFRGLSDFVLLGMERTVTILHLFMNILF